jgi:hypothetical protein
VFAEYIPAHAMRHHFLAPIVLSCRPSRSGDQVGRETPLLVSISTERLTRFEFPETPRSVFFSRPDIAGEKKDRSLYVRALAPEIEDTLSGVGESRTRYEINLSASDNR